MGDTHLQLTMGLDKTQAKQALQAFARDAKTIQKQVTDDAISSMEYELKEFVENEEEKQRMLKRGLDHFLAVSKATGKGAEDAAGKAGKGWGNLGAKIFDAAKGAVSFGAGMAGLDSAASVVKGFIDHWKDLNKQILDANHFLEDYQKALRELAALKGQGGETTKTLKEDIQFRKETLQSAEDARAFQLAALGAGEAFIDKEFTDAQGKKQVRKGFITKDEAEKARRFAGAFQAMEGGSAETHGTLVGMIPGLIGKRMTGEEVARTEAQLFNIFQPGAASFTSLSSQFLKSASPIIGAKAIDPRKAAAMVSMFSLTSKEGAGTMLEQFVRGTLGGVDRTGRPRVEGGTTLGDYYKSIGITDDVLKKTKSQDWSFMIANKISEDMLQKETAANKRGEEFNRLDYLKHAGFANDEDRRAIVDYASRREKGTLKTFLDLAEDSAMPTIEQARAPVVKAQQTDPAMQAMTKDLAKAAAKTALAAGAAGWQGSMQEMAWHTMVAEGSNVVAGDFDANAMNPWAIDVFSQAKKNAVNMKAQQMVLEQAKQLGIRTKSPLTTAFERELGAPDETFLGWDYLKQVAGQVNRAGGTSLPGLGGIVGRAEEAADKAMKFEGRDVTEKMEDQTKRLETKLDQVVAAIKPNAPAPPAKAPVTPRR